jgi:hypothetical protein
MIRMVSYSLLAICNYKSVFGIMLAIYSEKNGEVQIVSYSKIWIFQE